ncbi:MAG: aminopeptidase P family N-terminal domain-containing protein, partial [Ruminococcus sp.]|nr:aminopeptidase P family N-terminal domain-containing protein [Ruminococcus sp.]
MTKFERLFSQLPESIDCALITSDINRRYFTGMKSSDGTVIAFRDGAYLIIDFRYIEKARATVTSAEVIEQKKLYVQLNELIREHKASKVAIESQTLTVSRLHIMQAQLKDVEVIDTDVLSNAINALR